MDKHLYERVIIIDDTKLDRFITARMLRNDLFAEKIIDFSSAISALDYLTLLVNTPELFPQVIFLDINMPEMDGFEFIDKFIQFPDFIKDICSIIILSNTNSQEDIDRIKAYSATGLFFPKPLSEKSLCNIREYMEGKVVI